MEKNISTKLDTSASKNAEDTFLSSQKSSNKSLTKFFRSSSSTLYRKKNLISVGAVQLDLSANIFMDKGNSKFTEIKKQPGPTAENSTSSLPVVEVLAASSQITKSLQRPQTQQTALIKRT